MDKMLDDQIIIWFHIPRTGGTATFSHFGNHFSREDNQYLTHYNWINSPYDYQATLIPMLHYRTKEQQRHLKFLTGHSVFCNSHKWLRVYKEPLYITTVREPVERLLSSFNYRNVLSTLTQNPTGFTRISPLMNSNAVNNVMEGKDYDTLYHYLMDSSAEKNMQCKFLLAKFMKFDKRIGWDWHPTYSGNWDYMDNPETSSPVDHPEWWWDDNLDVDYFEALKHILPKFFYIGTTENLDVDVPALCEYANATYFEEVDSNSSSSFGVDPIWTIEDVRKQPDYDRLQKALRYDYKLYEYAKKFRRPF